MSESQPPTAVATPQLLTIKEARTWANVSRQFIFQAMKDGRLPAIRFSPQRVRIDRQDLETLIQSHRTVGRKEVVA